MNSKAGQFPRPLEKNDRIAIVAPAGQVRDMQLFRDGVRILTEMGYAVTMPEEFWPGEGYLADIDENRANEFNKAFADPGIAGIIALRGGYGCLRILGRLDLELISRNPKALVGFSDISLLQNFLYHRAGLISYHGPVLTSLGGMDTESLEALSCCLQGGWRACLDKIRLQVLRDGPTVEGSLIGGNLSSLVTLIGTKFDTSWENSIVLLEDTNEPLYKIDRMLTQLRLAGKLGQAAGLILGDFSNDHDRDERAKQRYREAVRQIVLDLTGRTPLLITCGFPSGHTSRNLTFPIGATVRMNCRTGRLSPC
jgi:muramoyltetrapeptide carboxypeptidase